MPCTTSRPPKDCIVSVWQLNAGIYDLIGNMPQKPCEGLNTAIVGAETPDCSQSAEDYWELLGNILQKFKC